MARLLPTKEAEFRRKGLVKSRGSFTSRRGNDANANGGKDWWLERGLRWKKETLIKERTQHEEAGDRHKASS